MYGVFDSLASAGFGFVIQKVGRVPIFMLGAAINFTVIVVMLSWQPQADQVFGKYLKWNIIMGPPQLIKSVTFGFLMK